MTNAVTPTAASGPNQPGKPGRPATTNADAHGPTSGPLSGSLNAKETPEVDYTAKHTVRAKTYLTQKNYDMAVQELRDALRLSPQNPELHSMIGQAYFKQKMSGMAKAHFRQALKLKPHHKVAQKYGKLLGLSESPQESVATSKHNPTPGTTGERAPEKPAEKRAWLEKLLKR